jgi:hypothetical protein
MRSGDAEPSDLDWNKGGESARQAVSEAIGSDCLARQHSGRIWQRSVWIDKPQLVVVSQGLQR